MVQIIPAILATTEEEYQQKLQKIEGSGLFEGGWVQIDLMDNKFVQNQSVNSAIIAKYPTNLKIEVQLMVEYPENWIDDLIEAKVNRIVFPVEDEMGIDERINHIKNHNIEVGLSINPETPVEKLTPFIDKIDLVLIMSVNPGFGGQEFIPESVEKVKKTSRLRSKSNYSSRSEATSSHFVVIEVDGGIDEKVAKELVEAGTDNLVVGSHLLEGNIEENLEKIWEAING